LGHFISRACAVLAVVTSVLIPAVAQAPLRAASGVRPIEIRAQGIESFDPREPSRKRFGKLTFRGGLILESRYRDFGGISSIRVEAGGEHFLAASDRGSWLRGRIVSRDKVPIAIKDAEMAPILGADGRPLKSRGWYDSESLARDGDTVWLGIERVQQIVRFDYGKDGLRSRGVPIAVPSAFKTLPHNQGLECLAAAPKDGPLGGMLIMVSERAHDTHGNLLGFLIGGEGGTFSLKRTDDFDVSDCALTPDHKLLVLERRFSWARGVAMRIRSIPLSSIKPGALVDGPELIYADMGYQIDNMEGLSVHREADGTQVLTLVSDDTFSALQRTLLLQFALTE
jgi:hypothetical protein